MNNKIRLVISLAIPLVIGSIGSIFTSPSVPTWYATLTKSSLTPPSWVFGPVWTTLFILMGIALFLVWRRGVSGANIRPAIIAFGIQMVLNALWSILFFGAYMPGVALIDIVALWLAIIATIVLFGRISRPSAWLLAPYILWVSFATYLNYAIWTLN